MDKVDAAMETSREGLRTLWLSLGILGLTSVIQLVVVALSGSVALLGDTIHNAADALTAVPLGIAFVLGRRAANRRYTYGYGRAEDLAGIVIVLTIAVSSAVAGYEAVDRLLNPAMSPTQGRGRGRRDRVHRQRVGGPLPHPHRPQNRLGRTRRRRSARPYRRLHLTRRPPGRGRLGSRLAGGRPLIGLLITAAILMVLRDAAREVYRRLMDCVDPGLIDAAETALRAVDGVRGVGQVRMRWIGHTLRAEADIVVDARLTVVQAHALAVTAEHALIHAVPRLAASTVHTDHTTSEGSDPHAALAHHTAHHAAA